MKYSAAGCSCISLTAYGLWRTAYSLQLSRGLPLFKIKRKQVKKNPH
jgi:hypothetical protein